MRVIVRALVAIVILAGSAPGEAHKPVTSPYTFTEDVLPILRDQCGRCHVDGGVAPMSLLTFNDTVPWGESIRVELMAGHMPPWDVDTPPSRFRNVNTLTARELDVLLTWAAGGTPPGADPPVSRAASTPPARRDWSLGTPDLLLDFPAPVTLAATVQDQVEEITLHSRTSAPRWVRAVDLMPGTPAIVRSATISVVPAAEPPGGSTMAAPVERVLSVWLPGEDPVPLDAGAGFLLPAAADLRVRIHYHKTWRHERDTMTDRSRIGLYFAAGPVKELRALTLSPSAAEAARARAAGRLAFSRRLDDAAEAVAIYPDANTVASRMTVRAVRPDGSGEELIAFRAMRDWSRRYWYREPIALPRGTRIDVIAELEGESALLPPAATPVAAADPSAIRLTVDLIASP